MRKFFITGIGTDVGKTVVSAIIVEALQADYWKPVQAGDLHRSDTDKVRGWVSNEKSRFHKSSYSLNTPMSPHAAADLDGIRIERGKFVEPDTSNDLVIEGAGGVLVPLNDRELVIDLIRPDDMTIVVSRNYLGSINHTLLTLEALKSRGINVCGLVFNGSEAPTTESIIESHAAIPVVGKIAQEQKIDSGIISKYAEQFKLKLQSL